MSWMFQPNLAALRMMSLGDSSKENKNAGFIRLKDTVVEIVQREDRLAGSRRA